eukprot:c19060_g1_i1 orf=303-2651(-)
MHITSVSSFVDITQIASWCTLQLQGWAFSVMPPCVDSPNHSQCPVRVMDGSPRKVNHIGDIHTRPVGRRRILVQTDTGNVLGMAFDRADSVQAVKNRLQTLLHMPMEQVALVCGDIILKSDLNELRNDTPVLLSRNLQRSFSSPCLSPSSEFQMEVGPSHVLEVVGGLMCCSKMRVIIKEIVKAIKCGVEPVPISGGLGGAYYFRNTRGESVAIIKPTDEEPLAPNNPKGFVGRKLGQHGLKKAIRVGETGVREVAAYLLDHENFAKVPPTVLVKITHHAFHINSAHANFGKPRSSVTKLASCQEFACHDFDASDRGSSGFSVAAVHKIGILDIRIFNTDRHAGNILVKKVVDMPGTWGGSYMHVNSSLELIPIDHGLCLPESLEDPYFEWLHWPQAMLPFSEEELDYIQRLDAKEDVYMLRAELPMLRVACLRMLILSTTFLKKAAAAGLCLAEVGGLMSRDGLEEISQLELFCLKAKEEAENKLAHVLLDDDDDDDYFSDNAFGVDDLQQQFEFELEEDDEFCEDNGQYNAFQSQNKYLRSKVASKVKSTATDPHCHSANERTLKCGNLSEVTEMSGKKMSSLLHASSFPPHLEAEQQSCLKYLCEEGSPLEEEDFTFSLPARQRTSCVNGVRIVSKPILVLNSSDRSSSKSSPTGTRRKDGVSQLSQSMASWQISQPPVRAMSYKSASLSDRKQRSKFLDQRTFGMPRVSASETLEKVKVAGSATAISFGELSEEEWICFMDCFEQILQEAFANRCSEPAGYKQRLGISLPVLRQRHFH